MYYVEHINNKQWMAKEVVALNGGMESKMVESRIRKINQEQCNVKQVFLIFGFVFKR
jgi:hypothetical protein